MYGQNRLADIRRIAKACSSNLVARLAPATYVRLSKQTGRGAADTERVDDIALYFQQCFDDYFRILSIDNPQTFLCGKTILEYGPGDLPGVALLMVAYGAERVICVDRFPLVAISTKNVAVLERLLTGLSPEARQRASTCFRVPGVAASGFDPARIEYLVRPSGLSGLSAKVDLIISRAVLEHVDDLHRTFADMKAALKEGGVSVHQVDLRSHGLHHKNPLDFLTWPVGLWNWMYSHKGVPNRWRVDRYRDIVKQFGFNVRRIEPTHFANVEDVAEVRSHLASPFRSVSNDDLSWLGFWLVICR